MMFSCAVAIAMRGVADNVVQCPSVCFWAKVLSCTAMALIGRVVSFLRSSELRFSALTPPLL
jgi:hypothetical protein